MSQDRCDRWRVVLSTLVAFTLLFFSERKAVRVSVACDGKTQGQTPTPAKQGRTESQGTRGTEYSEAPKSSKSMKDPKSTHESNRQTLHEDPRRARGAPATTSDMRQRLVRAADRRRKLTQRAVRVAHLQVHEVPHQAGPVRRLPTQLGDLGEAWAAETSI